LRVLCFPKFMKMVSFCAVDNYLVVVFVLLLGVVVIWRCCSVFVCFLFFVFVSIACFGVVVVLCVVLVCLNCICCTCLCD